MPAKFKIFQIYYNKKTKRSLSKRFIPLDNTANERPDWFEFWVIRNYLHSMELDPDTFYGFLSPRFSLKTGISDFELVRKIRDLDKDTDAFLVTYAPIQLAAFQNVFLQGEVNHPNLINHTNDFLSSIGLSFDISQSVTDFSNSFFSNYIIARPRYWRAWLELADRFFDYAEHRERRLGALNTDYKSASAPMKTFIQERLSALVLIMNNFKTVAPTDLLLARYDPGTREIVMSLDLSKKMFRETGEKNYLLRYHEIINRHPVLKTLI